MRACSSQFFVLEHYLRLATRNPSHWLSSLRALTGNPELSQEVTDATGQKDFCARLAFLPGKRVNLCGIYLNLASQISGSNAEMPAVILTLDGTAEFEVDGHHFLSKPGVPFVLEPNAEFCASVSAEAHLFIVQVSQSGSTESRVLPENGDPNLARILENFLVEAPFFRGHEHAMDCVHCFERALMLYWEGGGAVSALSEVNGLVGDDRRICQALRLINERLKQGVELVSIARDSGLSLRNLYYLMRKYTGMTPYSYCRSRRLIKVRESLISNYQEMPLIADHARKWGFNHLGRFSSYYLENFGEYPSDTLECLKALTESSQSVLSSEGGFRQPKAWYASESSHCS